MEKKRILFLSEASFLGSGYGAISRELLRRFYDCGEYEVAELACYASPDSPQLKDYPWKIYPNAPLKTDEQECKLYQSNQFNQFGIWKWEQTCLDFEPNVVCAYRDHWYDKFIIYSPFRRFYRILWQPTVDSYPLNKEWIADYTMTDGCLSYTKWGEKVLKNQCGDKINFMGVATPGADTANFYPIADKDEIKKQFGIDNESIIIGFVARNQIRKLFPELLENFVLLLNDLPKEKRDKTYLYLHTAYPDHGWEIPFLLKEFGLATKVLFTYYCKNCNHIFSSFYRDIYAFCGKCSQFGAVIPSGPEALISSKFMNNIYNVFDIYVQFASAEGLGIPAMEAGAAGLPTMVVDYSGMRDYVTEIGMIPINPHSYKSDIYTGRFMASPDKNDFINKLKELVLMPNSMRRSIGFQHRKQIEAKYSWDNCFSVWKNGVDKLPPPSNKWRENGRISMTPLYQEKPELSNLQYVNWLIADVLQKPEFLCSYFKLKLLRDLNWRKQKMGEYGVSWSEESLMSHMGKFKDNVTREDIYNDVVKLVEFNNQWEQTRLAKYNI